MNILTIDQIKNLMRHSDQYAIASDGWADIDFTASVEDSHRSHVFKKSYVNTYRLEFGCKYEIDQNSSPEEDEFLKNKAAFMLHHEIYGGLIGSLLQLKHKINYCPKQECVYLLEGILEQLNP